MRNGGGKQKGGEYERQICKRLSMWLTDGKNDSTLWRSAMSGGRATLALQSGKQIKEQCGDISSISPESASFMSQVYIECKFYKELGIANFFLQKPSKLMQFWIETIKQADAHNKTPLLIAKQNYFDDLAIFLPKFIFDILTRNQDSLKSLTMCNCTSFRLDYMVCTLDGLLTYYKFKQHDQNN